MLFFGKVEFDQLLLKSTAQMKIMFSRGSLWLSCSPGLYCIAACPDMTARQLDCMYRYLLPYYDPPIVPDPLSFQHMNCFYVFLLTFECE
jgi:hypothetical protein